VRWGCPSIEPELREGRGEIERALTGKLPNLVGDRDLHGILHCHTDASDDTNFGADGERRYGAALSMAWPSRSTSIRGGSIWTGDGTRRRSTAAA
jgi:hypothetical protein